jgi:hydrogenase maturation protein HypF
VWQNTFLLGLTVGLLQENEFKVYLHRQVPANDGGLSLGQAVVAIVRLSNGSA